MRNILRAWKKVYSNWKYTLSLIIVAVLFYLINVIIKNFNSLISFYNNSGFLSTLTLLFNLSIGLKETIKLSGFVTLLIISILIGILFTLIAYRISSLKKMDKKTGLLTTIGLFLGIAAPSCAACGVGLITLFGIGAATIASLPLEGLEISLLAILILIISIYKTSKDLLSPIACKI